MKVKQLIKILSNENPDHYVGRRSFGQDTGDWYTFDDDEIIVRESPESVEYDEL